MRSCESPILTLFFRDPDLASMASCNTLTGPQIFLIPTLITGVAEQESRKRDRHKMATCSRRDGLSGNILATDAS